MNNYYRSTLDKYSLADLLKIREDMIGQKKELQTTHGPRGYTEAIAAVQKQIHYRRTHRKKSGLIIPYNKDIMDD